MQIMGRWSSRKAYKGKCVRDAEMSSQVSHSRRFAAHPRKGKMQTQSYLFGVIAEDESAKIICSSRKTFHEHLQISR